MEEYIGYYNSEAVNVTQKPGPDESDVFSDLVSTPITVKRGFGPFIKDTVVEPTKRAVVTRRGRSPEVFGPGPFRLPGWLPHTVQIQYVDVGLRTWHTSPFKGRSLDDLEVSFRLAVTFMIDDLLLAVQASDLESALQSATEAYVRDFVQSHTHNTLVGKSHDTASNVSVQAERIFAKLRGSRALVSRGIRIVDVTIVDRCGDEEVLQARQNARRDRVRFAAEEAAVAGQKQVAEARRELVLLEADTDSEKVVAEARGKLQAAQIQREELEWQNEQRIKLERAQQALETARVGMQSVADMGKGAAEVAANSPTLRSGFGDADASIGAVLKEGIDAIREITAASSDVDPREGWRKHGDRLQTELHRLRAAFGATLKTERNGDRSTELRLRLNGVGLRIICPECFPEDGPETLIITPDGSQVGFDFPWDATSSLREVVFAALVHYYSQNGHGDGAAVN